MLLIESRAKGMIGSILRLSEDDLHVRHGAAPHLPPEYIRAVDGSPIGPCAGCCGTAMYLRKTVIVSDIQTDPLWRDYRDLAGKFGLRACWSTPILSHSGRMLGSFAMYYREPRKPRPDEMRLTAVAARLIALALERERAEEELRLRNRQIHELAGRLISAQEEERRRISRELHDDLIQRIAALALNLSLLNRPAAASRQSNARDNRAIQRQVSELEQIVRNLSHQLHPAILEHLGLVVALRSFAEEFNRLEQVEVSLTVKKVEEPICTKIGLCAYRIVQEALRNVVKHSGARKAEVGLAIEDRELVLTVKDEGKGFHVNRSRGRGGTFEHRGTGSSLPRNRSNHLTTESRNGNPGALSPRDTASLRIRLISPDIF